MLILFVYFIELIGDLLALLRVSFAVLAIATVICLMQYVDTIGEHKEIWLRRMKKFFCWLVASAILLVVIPSKQVAYVMSGIYVGQRVLEGEKLNGVLDKAYLIIEKKLDMTLDEMIQESAKTGDNKK